MLKLTDYSSKMGRTSHTTGGAGREMDKMHKLDVGISCVYILLFRMRKHTYTDRKL